MALLDRVVAGEKITAELKADFDRNVQGVKVAFKDIKTVLASHNTILENHTAAIKNHLGEKHDHLAPILQYMKNTEERLDRVEHLVKERKNRRIIEDDVGGEPGALPMPMDEDEVDEKEGRPKVKVSIFFHSPCLNFVC